MSEGKSMTVKVSVIIPVYNTEKYLPECLQSLIDQTLKDIEIICVDDGSTDQSVEVIKKYQQLDSRIILLQQENKYAGVARNYGMTVAKGDYLVFLDSDDFFEKDLLEKEYDQIEKYKADICFCRADHYDTQEKTFKPMDWSFYPKYFTKEVMTPAELGNHLYQVTTPAPWTKMFSHKLVRENKLQFQPLQRANDLFFVHSAMGLAKKLTYVNQVLVHYRVNNGKSLQNNNYRTPTAFIEALKGIYVRLDIKHASPDLKQTFHNSALANMVYNLKTLEKQNRDSVYEKTLDIIKKVYIQFFELSGHGRDYFYAKENYDYLARYGVFLDAPANRMSVIINVCGSDENIEECLQRVINQSIFYLMQVICVDDGVSADHESSVLKTYEEKYENILVLHQESADIGAALNAGIEKAVGEYITFLDGDTWYANDKAAEKLLRKMEKDSPDMLKAGFSCFNARTKSTYDTDYSTNAILSKEKKEKVISFADSPKELAGLSDIPWNGFYRTEFLKENHIRFDGTAGNCFHTFYIHSLLKAEKIIISNEKSICCRVNPDAAVTSAEAGNFDSCPESYERIRQLALACAGNQAPFILQGEILAVFREFERLVKGASFPVNLLTKLKSFARSIDEAEVGGEFLQKFDFAKLYDLLRHQSERKTDEDDISVSVVIPINRLTEKISLIHCLNGLANQVVGNIEVLCIYTEESGFNSHQVQSYLQNNLYIRCIPLERKSPEAFIGESLKTAAACAKGKYLLFLDNFVNFEAFTLKNLLENASGNSANITVGNLIFEDPSLKWLAGKKDKHNWVVQDAIEKNDQAVEKLFLYGCPLLCQLLIHRDLLLDFKPDTDDNFFLPLMLLCKAKVVSFEVSFAKNIDFSISKEECGKLSEYLLANYDSILKDMIHTRHILLENHLWGKAGREFINFFVYFFANYLKGIQDRDNHFRVAAGLKDSGLLDYWPEFYENKDDLTYLEGQLYALEWYEKTSAPKDKEVRLVCPGEVENPKISVIIPVYNVEEYLRPCLDSALCQTFRDIEILCINDGSKDSSLEILKEYAAKDKRIYVYSQENSGLSAARNTGLEHARGKYVYFFDSDDLLEEDALGILYDRLKSDNLDILFFNAYVFSEDDGPEIRKTIEGYNNYYKRKHDYNRVFSGPELFHELRDNKEYLPSACLQILRTAFLKDNKISFIDGILHEDEIFTFKSLLTAKRASHINKSFYGRRIHANSIMTTKKSFRNVHGYFVGCEEMQKILDSYDLTEEQYASAQNTRENLYNLAYKYYKGLSAAERLSYLGLPVPMRNAFQTRFIKYFRKLEQDDAKAEKKYKGKLNASGKEIQNLKKENSRLVNENKKITGERDYWHQEWTNVKSGYSFRIGRVITFIPRKVRGGRRCLREHGWGYTFRRTLWHLGLISKWHE